MKIPTLLLLLCFACGLLPAQPAPSSGAYLGVQITDVDPDRASRLKLADESGVEVTAVQESSPASNAGIQPGDALLTYNGESILGSVQLIRLVRETPVGRHVRIQLWRDGKSKSVTVILAAQPPAQYISIGQPGFSPQSSQQMDTPAILVIWRSSMLGIECEGVSPQLADFFGVKNGILVRSVEKNATGGRSGLKAGDILISIGGRPILSPSDLNSYHRSLRSEAQPITVSLVRDRKVLNLQITPE